MDDTTKKKYNESYAKIQLYLEKISKYNLGSEIRDPIVECFLELLTLSSTITQSTLTDFRAACSEIERLYPQIEEFFNANTMDEDYVQVSKELDNYEKLCPTTWFSVVTGTESIVNENNEELTTEKGGPLEVEILTEGYYSEV